MSHRPLEDDELFEVADGSEITRSLELPVGAWGGMLVYADVLPDESSDDPSLPNSIHASLELVPEHGGRGAPVGQGSIANPGRRFPGAARRPYASRRRLQVVVRNESGSSTTIRVSYMAQALDEPVFDAMPFNAGRTNLSWPQGYLFPFDTAVTNPDDAGGAGNVEVRAEPGDGNEFKALYGHVSASAAANTKRVTIRDAGGADMVRLVEDGSNSPVFWPNAVNNPDKSDVQEPLVGGNLDLRYLETSVADGDSMTARGVVRCTRNDPTITTVTP